MKTKARDLRLRDVVVYVGKDIDDTPGNLLGVVTLLELDLDDDRHTTVAVQWFERTVAQSVWPLPNMLCSPEELEVVGEV